MSFCSTNEIDNSLADIHTSFRAEGYNKPELHALIDYIAQYGLTAKEAKKRLGRQYKLPNDKVNEFYNQLVNLMREYKNS